MVVTLPDSPYLLSISMFILSGNWLFEARFREKFKLLKKRKSLWIVLSIYLVYVLWMINTQNLRMGFIDLRLKLPFIILPLIYGTSQAFSPRQFKIILQFFVASVVVNSLLISFILFGFTQKELIDIREASPFISHIRFSLMAVLSIYILFYILFLKQIPLAKSEKYSYPIIILWLISFLFFFQTLTGVVIFIALLPVATIWWAKILKKRKFLYLSLGTTLLIWIAVFLYMINAINSFNQREEIDPTSLEKMTANENPYRHYLDIDEYENGNRIWIYVASEELAKEWDKKSNIPYDNGLDKKGQCIQFTLIRYMSSLGLRKDSLAFSKLSDQDIKMIENGYTNYIFRNKYSFNSRVYEVLWEINHYRKTGDPSGQSLSQRLEYLKIGSNLSGRFFWFGTGTGDLMQEFRKQYVIERSKLSKEIQRRAHNQYLTFLITFGIFGALWMVFAFIAPVIIDRRYQNFLVVASLCIILLSMINEDTLDTHIGVSFVAFFYTFFLYAMPLNDPGSDEKA